MADAKNDIVLSIRGMSKSFGRNRVLDHINLDVKRGTVMGLMGENGAGKSTMMKCLFGTYQKDEGKIFLNGKEISFSGPKDALENGIAMVHQELNQCLERSVTDNLFLGRYPTNVAGIVDEGGMKKKASELFRKLGMTVNLSQPMRNMSVSQRQMCEIAKAISYNSQVIVGKGVFRWSVRYSSMLPAASTPSMSISCKRRLTWATVSGSAMPSR